MLYVFWVERGTIIRLQVDVAVDTVLNLKTTLVHHTHIPEAGQVLLINGGEPLDDRSRVAKYQSGTDTNPIFLFNRDAIESERQPDFTSDSFQAVPEEQEAKEAIDGVLNLPVSFNAVVTRTQLAQQYYDFAKELNRQCSVLVQEQHLQHQGWQAVMANLDDVVSAFRKRLDKFQVAYRAYLDSRNDKLQSLMSFGDNVEVLSKIPLFPALVRPKRTKTSKAVEASTEDVENKEGAVATGSDENEITIIDWISAKDSDHDLISVADGCRRTIETFDDSTLEDVLKDSQVVIGLCNNPSMKEIKGLAERLFSLDGLLTEAKKLVLEQKETADVLQKMQQQVTSRDVQLIKDLAVSFTQHLQQVLKSHGKLCSIKKRCLAAKQELCNHLHVRLNWVVKVENGISEVDDKVKIYFENVRKIKRLTHMLEQVRNVPHVYLSAVEEVLRRRHYAEDFVKWASTVAKTASQSYVEESEARKTFLSTHGSHFLCGLFPGLDQFPPQFATNPPIEFDSSLPALKEADLRQLLDRVPTLSQNFRSPTMKPTSQLVPCPLVCTVQIPSEEGDASVTRNRRVSFHSDSTEVVPLMETALISTCTTQERQLLDSLPQAFLTYRNVLTALRTAHENLKKDLIKLREIFRTFVIEGQNELQVELEKEGQLRREAEERFHVTQDRLTDSERRTGELEDEVKRLREDYEEEKKSRSEAEEKLAKCEQHGKKTVDELQRLREELDRWKEESQRKDEEKDAEISRLKTAVGEVTLEKEQLKAELQDTATHHEKALAQAGVEKNLAIELERERVLSEHLPSSSAVVEPLPSTSVGLQFPEESPLVDSPTNEQYQPEPISPRSDTFFPMHPPARPPSSHLPRVYTDSLLATHGATDSMESSVSVQAHVPNLMEMSYMSTIPQSSMSGPQASSPRPNQLGGAMYSTVISLTSCNAGELVLFVYNKDFKQYTGYLPFKRSLYLLHSDSHADLGLQPARGPEGELMEVRSWVVAEIVGKEYVLTKKEPNRYRLKEGTRFYRVKAKSWDLENVLREAAAAGAPQPSSSLLP